MSKKIIQVFCFFAIICPGLFATEPEENSLKNLARLVDAFLGFFLMIFPTLGFFAFIGILWHRSKFGEVTRQNKFFSDRLEHIESYMTSIAETQAEVVHFSQSLADYQEKLQQRLSQQSEELSKLSQELSKLDLKSQSLDGVLESISRTTNEIQQFSTNLNQKQLQLLEEQTKLRSGYETLEQHTQEVAQTTSQLIHEQTKLRSGYETLEQHTQEVAKTAFEIQLNQRKMKEAQDRLMRQQRNTTIKRYSIYVGLAVLLLLILWLYQNVLYFLLMGLFVLVLILLYLKFRWLPQQQNKTNPNMIARFLFLLFPPKPKNPASLKEKAILLSKMAIFPKSKPISQEDIATLDGAIASPAYTTQKFSFSKKQKLLLTGGVLVGLSILIYFFWK